MPDVREAYEMITKQKPPEPGALERQQKRQVRAARNKRIGAFAVAAAIGLAAIAVILETRAGEDTKTTAGQPSTVAPGSSSGPFLLDLRTGKRTPLPANLAGGVSYVPSPDGTRLLILTCHGQPCSNNKEDVTTVANIDGTDARMLRSPEGLNYYGARWSPDGTKIVYQERKADTNDVGNLFVEDLSTGRRTQLTHLKLSRPAVLTEEPSGGWWWFLSPSFSPDGRNVFFHMPRSSSQTTNWDVWSVPVTGGEPTLVLRNAAFPVLNPSGGPEGVAIAFVETMPNSFAGRNIMTGRPIPDSDIRRERVGAKISIWWPTFSPDGSKIAYQDGGSIYVVNVGPWDLPSKVVDWRSPGAQSAEWLDDDTLIVAP
jgi:Tol biopolymer transport system component